MFVSVLLIKIDPMAKFIVSVGDTTRRCRYNAKKERKSRHFCSATISQPGHLIYMIFNLLVWALHGTPEHLPGSPGQGVCIS